MMTTGIAQQASSARMQWIVCSAPFQLRMIAHTFAGFMVNTSRRIAGAAENMLDGASGFILFGSLEQDPALCCMKIFAHHLGAQRLGADLRDPASFSRALVGSPSNDLTSAGRKYRASTCTITSPTLTPGARS